MRAENREPVSRVSGFLPIAPCARGCQDRHAALPRTAFEAWYVPCVGGASEVVDNNLCGQGSLSMETKRFEIERISVTSSKSFAAVVEALEAAIGHPNIAELEQIRKGAGSFAELERAIQHVLGRTDLMLFTKLDLGAILRKESGHDSPKIVRLLVGNPLIMKEMAKYTPAAGSYAPVTILVDERPDGVHLAYDRMVSFLAPYENAHSLAIARMLDVKVESWLREAAGD